MNIRIYNANILTMAEGCAVRQGEVWVRDDRIVHVGEADSFHGPEAGSRNAHHSPSGRPVLHTLRDSAPFHWDREIDARGNLVMPGFKDAHTHSAMTFLRSYADDLPLWDWLHKQVFPMEAKLTPEDIYHLSKLAIMEYLTSGITANFDMYLTPDTIAQASVDTGFRTVIVGALNDFTQSVAELEKWYDTYNHYHPLISFQLGFHAQYTTGDTLLRELSALSHQKKAPVWCHNSETAAETAQCVEHTGMTPTAYLDSLGLYDFGGGGYHCIYMSEKDLEIFRDRGLYAVTNPASNLKLASGIAPLTDIMDMDIPVAIGTDGPASNNCLDMFREMFLVIGLAKLREKDAAAMDANDVLAMATVNGAHAMGLADCDTLEPGKLADLILIDLHRPNMQPINNMTKNIVYSGSKENVLLTMVNGRILYEKGEFYIGTDPEEIYRKANAITSRLKS